MLQAFIDDSASDHDDQLLFLAGYINFAPRWSRFSNAWQRVLNAQPSIQYFRMAEAKNLSGEFKGWHESTRDKKLDALANVVKYSNPCSIVCSVSRRDFASILQPVAPYALRHPYFVCFYGVINSAARWLLQTEGGDIAAPVDFIFDEHGDVGMEAVEWYYAIKEMQEPSVKAVMGSTPIFRDDQVVLPLQAADFLAWHLRRQSESRYASEHRELSKRLLGHDHIEMKIGRPVLESLAAQMLKVPGVDEVRDRKSWKQSRAVLGPMLSAPPDSPAFIANYLRNNAGKIRLARLHVQLLSGFNKARRLFRIVRRFLFGSRR